MTFGVIHSLRAAVTIVLYRPPTIAVQGSLIYTMIEVNLLNTIIKIKIIKYYQDEFHHVL